MSWVVSDFPVVAGLDAAECSDEMNLGHLTDSADICTPDQLREAATFCKPLMDSAGPFSSCHANLPPAEYFEDCVYDLCLFFENEIDHVDAMCELYSSYAGECNDMGVYGFSWREHIEGCAVSCGGENEAYYSAIATEDTCDGDHNVAGGDIIEGTF